MAERKIRKTPDETLLCRGLLCREVWTKLADTGAIVPIDFRGDTRQVRSRGQHGAARKVVGTRFAISWRRACTGGRLRAGCNRRCRDPAAEPDIGAGCDRIRERLRTASSCAFLGAAPGVVSD